MPRFPTLIVAGFVTLSALLSFFCGLILDTLTKRERQDFEVKLNMMQMLRDDIQRRESL